METTMTRIETLTGRRIPGHIILALLLCWLTSIAYPAHALIEFSRDPLNVLESSGTATVNVSRTGAAESAASIRVLVTHGSAVRDQDFTGGDVTLTWAAGETGSKPVVLAIVTGDAANEGTETVFLALTSITGDTLGWDRKEVAILDNLAAGDPGLSTEQQRAAVVIDSVCSNHPSASSCALFQDLTDLQQQAAIESILPRYVAQQVATAATAQLGGSQAVSQRMQMVRGGVRNSVAGLRLMLDGEMVPLQAMLDEFGVAGGNAGDELLDDKWGFFASGSIAQTDQDSTEKDLGYVSDSQQITLGFDYRFNPNFFAGTALNYSISNVDTNDDVGEQDSDTVLASVFASYYFLGSFYVDTLLSYGVTSFESERKIVLGDYPIHLKSDADGSQWGIAATVGYDKNISAWQLGGYLRAEAGHFNVDAYDESGDDAFALAIDQQESDSQQTVVGVSGSYVYPVSYGIWVPKLTIEWIQELEDDEREIEAHFVASPESGNFRIITSTPDSSYYNAGWSIAGTFGGGRSVYLRYDIQIDRENYVTEVGELGVRIPF